VKKICENRRARHEYHVLETYEAGIALVGTEVKSLREGKASLTEAYARVEDSQVFLVGMHISPYEPGSRFNHDPRRKRRLLLRAREIKRLRGRVEEKGLTLIPLRLYFNDRGLAKVEIGLVRGKRTYDKRKDIAEREAKRAMDRARKQRSRE
jgi:SsrA-binding protein